MASPTSAMSSRRPDIEGLRGLAVLLVVYFHAGLPGLSGAFVAVDVFFVLSGFFLTSTLLKALVTGDEISLGDVYARRVWRLLPAMTVVLLATLAMAMLFYAPIDRATVADNMRPVAFFAGNLAFAASGVNYFSAGENPLLHTWTLGVEYQLVLFFPALVLLLARLGRRRAEGLEASAERRVIVTRTVFNGIVIAGLVSFACAVWINDTAPMWAYFGPHTRLWSVCAGAGMAFVAGGGQSVYGASAWRINLAQLAGLAAILLPALFYDRGMSYPGVIALVPVGGTLLLLSGGDVASGTLVGRLLGLRPLTWLGRVSYPWYLWHWPMMVLGAVLVPSIGPVGRLLWGLVGLFFAVLTQRFIEQKLNTGILSKVQDGRPLLWAAGVSLMLLLAATYASARSESYVRNSVHRTFAAARNDRMEHNCWVRSVDDGPRGACAFGDVRSATTVALLGDSHAEHWLGGLDRAGRQHGWRIEANVMGGCPVSDFSQLMSGWKSERYSECSRYREAMLDKIVRQKPTAVILSSSDQYMEPRGDGYEIAEVAWALGLRRTYSRLAAAGIPVIVIRGTPWVPFDVPTCQSRRAANLLLAIDCVYEPDHDFIARARRAQNVAAIGLDVRFVDMNDVVCPAARCDTMRNGVVMFTDDNHLTASFSRTLAPVLGERLSAGGSRQSLLKTAAGLARGAAEQYLLNR